MKESEANTRTAYRASNTQNIQTTAFPYLTTEQNIYRNCVYFHKLHIQITRKLSPSSSILKMRP